MKRGLRGTTGHGANTGSNGPSGGGTEMRSSLGTVLQVYYRFFP
jgi:hypothetical protein